MTNFQEHKIIWTDEKCNRLWSYYSKTYPHNQMYFAKRHGSDILKRTEGLVGKISGKTVLDFGCGPGFLLEHMLKLGMKPKRYIGLDFSSDTVGESEVEYNLPFETEKLTAIGFPSKLQSNLVDICFLIEVIEHLNEEHLNKSLEEISRVLKPGGWLIVTTPNNENLELSENFCPECGCVFHKWQHVRIWNINEIREKMKCFDLINLRIEETNFFEEGPLLKKIHDQFKNFLLKRNISLLGVFEKR